MLKLALNKPHFDTDAIERIRQQLIATLVYAASDPDKVAENEWYALAFKGHPYALQRTEPSSRSAPSRTTISMAIASASAKDTLKVVAVATSTPTRFGRLLDEVFGGLRGKAQLTPIAKTTPVIGGKQEVIEMNVPQSVAVFGLGAMPRRDPDFSPAFV